jgi:hypothetical protein
VPSKVAAFIAFLQQALVDRWWEAGDLGRR